MDVESVDSKIGLCCRISRSNAPRERARSETLVVCISVLLALDTLSLYVHWCSSVGFIADRSGDCFVGMPDPDAVGCIDFVFVGRFLQFAFGEIGLSSSNRFQSIKLR